LQFQKGNSFWKERLKDGRYFKIKTKEKLLDLVTGYFEYCEQNPMPFDSYYTSKGELRVNYKPRPFTKGGLALYCGYAGWDKFCNLKKEPDYAEIITYAEELIFEQKYTNAAIGVFKENLIARDLGIADKQVNDGEITVNINRKIID
jgi:hypothetical protein